MQLHPELNMGDSGGSFQGNKNDSNSVEGSELLIKSHNSSYNEPNLL